MSEYVYKDNEKTMPALSAKLTSRIGDGTGFHEQAYLDTITMLASVLRSGSLIDIGCARGRITEMVADKISEVVALEPDKGRCDWARDVLAPHENVTVLNQNTADYIAENPGKQFDLALLSMVVQHLSTHYARQVMSEVAQLTRPGGIAIVATTHALEKTKCFTYQHVAEARISEEEFNAYADNPHGQDKGLPVHRFSRPEFEELAGDDFEIIHWEQFSYFRPEFLDAFASIHQVEPHEIQDHGNSQFMVLRKKS